MIESNNPEIDVNGLMERIRAEVERRRELGSPPHYGSGDAAPTVLPQVPFLTPLPPVASPRRVDVKEERLTSILQRAREKTEVSTRIPKLLRRFFRKQGGYNKLLLESVAVLTKTNVELNKRLQELAGGFEIQNRWLSDFASDMQIKLRMQINDIHTERHIAAESARTLRSEFDRACEHLRGLQAQADGMREVLDSSLARERGEIISAKPDSHQLDAFYLSFENRFRGTRDEIKKRLRFYLPILRKARAGIKARPVLDVGCGRGEWLELLREQKLKASGVDLNEAMVGQCKEYHLNVLQADAIEFLRSLPDRSQGAVTGFHIIEHLPFEMLIELIIQSRRVLKPGGIAIFESPNCQNLMVGACYFNVDPTHRNPVYPETAQFMLETQGFERVRLEYLSPMDTTLLGNIDEEPPHIRELLYGPQDFAVIGYAPAAE